MPKTVSATVTPTHSMTVDYRMSGFEEHSVRIHKGELRTMIQQVTGVDIPGDALMTLCESPLDTNHQKNVLVLTWKRRSEMKQMIGSGSS